MSARSASSKRRQPRCRWEAGSVRQRDRLPDGFGMQRGVAEIEWTDGGRRPFQRARHGREVAPDQVDHAGAENFSNVGIDVGDSPLASDSRPMNALPSDPPQSVGVDKGALRAVPTISQNHRREWWARLALPTLL